MIDPRRFDACRRPRPTLAEWNHEIRTPLNAILGFADLLESSERLDARERRYASHIQTAGRRLLAILKEILALAEHAGEGRSAGPRARHARRPARRRSDP